LRSDAITLEGERAPELGLAAEEAAKP